MWAALARLGGMAARGGAMAARGAAAEGGAASANRIGRLSQQFNVGGGGGSNQRSSGGGGTSFSPSSFEPNPTGAQFYGHG